MSLGNTETIEALKSGLDKIPAKDQSFVKSLLSQHATKGKLSEKQWYWVGKMAQSLEPKPNIPAFTFSVGPYDKVTSMLELAKKNLKFPKLNLQLATGEHIVCFQAGERAMIPGSITVKLARNEKGFSQRLGRVTKDGEFDPAKDAPTAIIPSLLAMLTALGADPVATVAAYGHKSGNCCFCMLPLTDERSLHAGYGPTCAKNYGLPWGDK